MRYALAGLGREAAARAAHASRVHSPADVRWLWLTARLAVIRRGQSMPTGLPQLKDAAAVSALVHRLAPAIANDPQEQAITIAVDVQKKPLALALIYRGTVNRVPADPSNILRVPLLVPAVGFIQTHTHPQGNPRPSSMDLDGTRTLARAAGLVGLQLLDHVVLTPRPDTFYSIREHHPELWS